MRCNPADLHAKSFYDYTRCRLQAVLNIINCLASHLFELNASDVEHDIESMLDDIICTLNAGANIYYPTSPVTFL